MADLLQDPMRAAMLALLLVLEIPAAIFLVVAWFRDKKAAEEVSDENL